MFMKKLAALIGVLILITYTWYRFQLRALDGASAARVSIVIEPGTPTQRIGDMLAEKGLIRSPFAFGIYTRLHRSTLQAGSFTLQPAKSAPEIIEILQSGKTEERAITIPEGFTVKDIDALLVAEGLTKSGEVQNCALTCDFSTFDFLPTSTALAKRGGKLEGYLYPDTYFVNPADFVAKFFLERMLGTFRTRVVNAHAEDIKASGHSLHEIITMASLIEEETRKAEERPVVSGILWKRRTNGISLGVDAAVRYIVEKPTSAITRADLEVDSPYNVRTVLGLPPGPIANPSMSSIEAALSPQESRFWYYLHGTDGQIRYAETNEEHNRNRAQYLRS